MYHRHFGLTGSPFQFTPSSRLFASKAHREALAALEWGLLHEPSGFTLLIGETGTGKTTLVISILARSYEQLHIAYIPNPSVGFDGLLRVAMAQFGIEARPVRLEMLDAFYKFVSDLRPGARAAIIIDEAQSLSDESLEHLRLLSSQSRSDDRQIHFVLVGQPELAGKLMQPGLKQLNERIGARAILDPLKARECFAYVDYRLRAQGSSANSLFARNALTHIVEHSGGIPRRLNVLCHNTMLQAYAAGEKTVRLKAARAAVDEFENFGAATEPSNARPGVRERRIRMLRTAVIAAATASFTLIGVTRYLDPSLGSISSRPERNGGVSANAATSAQPEHSSVVAATRLAPSADSRLESSPNRLAASTDLTAVRGRTIAEPALRRIRVHNEGTLSHIALKYLGSKANIHRLIEVNPQLHGRARLYPGEIVYLPRGENSEDEE